MSEIWKDIKGYEGYYQVSNLGRVKRLTTYVTGKSKKGNIYYRLRKEHICKLSYVADGYLAISLSKDGIVKKHRVNIIVANAFIYNDDPENKTQVHHIDSVRDNNSVNNLMWVTPKENSNSNDRIEKLKIVLLNHTAYSKPIYQLTKNNEIIAEYPSIMEAGRDTGINYKAIHNCLKGLCNTTGGFKWKYKNG